MALATKIRENSGLSLRRMKFRSDRTRRLAEALVDEYVQLHLQEAYLSQVASFTEHSRNLPSLEEWAESLVRNRHPLMEDIVASAIHKAIKRTAEIEKIYVEERQNALFAVRSSAVEVGRDFEIRRVAPYWATNSVINIVVGVIGGFLTAVLLRILSLTVDFDSLADRPPVFGMIMIACLVSLWFVWRRSGDD
ncbi:MAG: hypothetical protein AAF919_10535 [Pseudomonadota bacterium]